MNVSCIIASLLQHPENLKLWILVIKFMHGQFIRLNKQLERLETDLTVHS